MHPEVTTFPGMTNDAVMNTKVDEQNKLQEGTNVYICDCTMMEQSTLDAVVTVGHVFWLSFKHVLISEWENKI